VMKKADEKTRQFFNDLVQEYRKTNDGNNDPGKQVHILYLESKLDCIQRTAHRS